MIYRGFSYNPFRAPITTLIIRVIPSQPCKLDTALFTSNNSKRLYVIILLIKSNKLSHTSIFFSSVLKCAVLAMIKRLNANDPSPYL